MFDLGNLSYFAAFAFGSAGSAIGMGIASLSVIGAWKKAFMRGKSADMSLLVFSGSPLSQVFYGFILMGQLRGALDRGIENTVAVGIISLLSGLLFAGTAIIQGQLAAAAADSQGETGKGLGQYIITIGLVETVALFVMVFAILQLNVLQ
jgi:V/A-type H+-transporting ATPase subunit K